jgi:hypothetical protein
MGMLEIIVAKTPTCMIIRTLPLAEQTDNNWCPSLPVCRVLIGLVILIYLLIEILTRSHTVGCAPKYLDYSHRENIKYLFFQASWH